MKLIKDFENYSIGLDGRVINNTTKKLKKTTDNHSGNGYLYVDLYLAAFFRYPICDECNCGISS